MPGPPPCRYCNLIFHYCREGACPSAAHCLYCPLLPPGRPCRGGIHAARPTFPSQPLAPIATHHPNIHLAQTSPSNFVEKIKKTCKNLLTKVILLAIIIKLSREPSPRRQPLEPLPTACTPFFEENFFKKLSENLLTNERI